MRPRDRGDVAGAVAQAADRLHQALVEGHIADAVVGCHHPLLRRRPRRGIDVIVALFADDAVVLDEGQTRRGTAEIRGWQEGTASRYQYTTQLLGADASDEVQYAGRR
jgi:hypothetical protein